MAESGARPRRPRELISRCGKFRIVPHVDVLRIEQIRSDTEEQDRLTRTYGPQIRIVYSRSMYDTAMQRADELLDGDSRISPTRIEFVFAQRDEMYALQAGSFDVVPISTATAHRGEK